jgi:tRNA (guanine37-N1)-methyltransferase
MEVPAVLRSGNHADIAEWRRAQSIARTARVRPDLLARASLTERERTLVESPADLTTSSEEG